MIKLSNATGIVQRDVDVDVLRTVLLRSTKEQLHSAANYI